MKSYVHIGAGGWGGHWLKRVIPANAELARCVAAVDLDPAALKSAETLLGLAPEKCYDSLETALRENPVDFVTIAASIPAHASLVETALRHGCHILCEKPMAESMEQCARIYRQVRQAGVRYAVTMSHRYEQDKQTLQALLNSGELGRLNYLVGRISIARTRWRVDLRTPERALIDGGVHNLDMVRAFSGCNARSVFARGWQFDPGDGKGGGMTLFVQAEMENGAQAFLEYGFGGAYGYGGWSNEYFRAECARASAELDNRRLTLHSHEGFPIPERSELPLLPGDCWDHNLIFRQFVAWLDGGEAPAISLEDNIHAMAMLYAAVESLRTGRPVETKDMLVRLADPV